MNKIIIAIITITSMTACVSTTPLPDELNPGRSEFSTIHGPVKSITQYSVSIFDYEDGPVYDTISSTYAEFDTQGNMTLAVWGVADILSGNGMFFRDTTFYTYNEKSELLEYGHSSEGDEVKRTVYEWKNGRPVSKKEVSDGKTSDYIIYNYGKNKVTLKYFDGLHRATFTQNYTIEDGKVVAMTLSDEEGDSMQIVNTYSPDQKFSRMENPEGVIEQTEIFDDHGNPIHVITTGTAISGLNANMTISYTYDHFGNPVIAESNSFVTYIEEGETVEEEMRGIRVYEIKYYQ